MVEEILDRYLELTGLVDEASYKVRAAIRNRDNLQLARELLERAWVEMCLRDLDYGNGIDWGKWMKLDVERAKWSLSSQPPSAAS